MYKGLVVLLLMVMCFFSLNSYADAVKYVMTDTNGAPTAQHNLIYGLNDKNELKPMRVSDYGESVSVQGTSTNQMRVEYNANGTILYLGYAVKGVAVSATTWTIYKFTYDVNEQVTVRQTAINSWNNRGTATYE